MATAKRWTMAEFERLPEDGRRYELIHGQLYVDGTATDGSDIPLREEAVTPSPSWTHQEAVGALFAILRAYLRRERVGQVKLSPADVALGEDVTVQPDLFVVPLVEGRIPRSWEEAGRLMLAVEVVSPSTARLDRTVKRELYRARGVAEYWIVDTDARVVERWQVSDERPEIVSGRLEWRPDGAAESLAIELAEYFAEVWGES